MQRHNPWTSLTYALLFSALSLNIVQRPLLILSESYTVQQWTSIMYIVVFGTLIPFGLYLVGVNYIRSTRTIITATLEPIAAAFMAFFLLGESLAPLQMIGGLSVIGAIILLQWEREHDALSPEAIRAGRK
jgi:drug/metabolite transporter (DMT)-like permease